MTLRIIDCKATPISITVVFSDVVNTSAGAVTSATNVGNYNIQETIPGNAPVLVTLSPNITPRRRGHAVVLTPSNPAGLTTGSWIGVTVSNVENQLGTDGLPTSGGAPNDFYATLVNGEGDEDKDIRQATRAAEDAVAYPLLTEEVGYAPSPLAGTSGAPPSGGRSAASLGQTVTQAVSDVLGWKIKPDDPKGFVGALTASFACSDFEGHTQCTWTPRTYAVQTDLAGGITGAQASIYSRAQGAVNQTLPLLDGLYPLDPEADPEDITALKGVARSQLTELVNELGLAGGPRVDRVNQYFQLLLQDPGTSFPPAQLVTDPDEIKGSLGSLRDVLGVNFQTQDFVNTVQDEQDLSNYRILSDYVTSLAQSWINNLPFFGLNTATPFFGTQLVLLSRQLGVVAEAVDEVRFTLDSVFIGPAERQTLELRFDQSISRQPLFAEDLFNWVQNFATEEGPRLIQDGGKYGVQFSFLPIAQKLQGLIRGAQDPNPLNRGLPPGYHTFRVQRALKQLGDELTELVNLAGPISHKIEEEPTKSDFDAIQQQLARLTQTVGHLVPPPQPPVPIPPALNFLQIQPVQTASVPQFVTLINANTTSMTISSINIQQLGGNAPSIDFTLIEPTGFPVIIAPQSALHISIAFTPTAPGNISASLVVTYDSKSLPAIPLSGTAQ